MRACEEIGAHVAEWAGLPPTDVPGWAREHVATCATCGRRLAAARLVRGLVRAGVRAIEAPEGFAARVAASAGRHATPGRAEVDLWRPAWGLVPAFAAVTAALLILFEFSPGPGPVPVGLLSAEGLTAGERIVLGTAGLEPDLVLSAVMEGDGI
jgi:hypothetical protein